MIPVHTDLRKRLKTLSSAAKPLEEEEYKGEPAMGRKRRWREEQGCDPEQSH